MDVDGEESLEGPESVEDNSMALYEDEDNEDEDMAETEETPETSAPTATKGRSRRKKRQKKRKMKNEIADPSDDARDSSVAIPDPYTATCDEVCEAIGLINVEVDYENPEFQGITNLKNFSIAVRPYILNHNPGTIVAKMYPMIQAKYKEFQDHMMAKGTPIQKQLRQPPPPPPCVYLEQSGPLTTRKSGRKKRSDGEGRSGRDSDQEFEALIKQHEKDQAQLEEEKERQRQQRLAAKQDKRRDALESARATKRARREQGEPEEAHHEYCEVCMNGGEIVLCDTCPRSYHVVCIDENMEQPPEGDWSCPYCVEHGIDTSDEPAEEKPALVHMAYCRICNETRNILNCTHCPSSYHAYCLNPPLEELPKEDWYCPRCLVQEPNHRIEKILTWRWVVINYPPPLEIKDGDIENPDDIYLKPPRKMPPRREKEFFVKWKHISYWKCEWLPEVDLDVNFTVLLRMYWRKVDPENPPMFDESTLSCHHQDNDPYQLRERFYQYGVKPEWMQIHRVINHVSYGRTQQDYLVKWKELAYEMSTWERDDADIADFEEAIAKYWMHRERMLEEDLPRNVVKMITDYREAKGLPERNGDSPRRKQKYKVDIRKKFETQPDYITETGGNLHPYQLEGINWLRHCWANRTDAILADEMGLGKTVQSLSFLYSLMKEGHTNGPFLIAAPLSTIINWEREAEQWCPDFYVVTYVGDQNSRTVLRENEFSFVDGAIRGGKASKMKTQENLKFHVLLTSYECINMDKAILTSINWAALVVDEAHRLKNNQSSFFKNLREYRINYRVLLTGTPLQNNLEELFHLLNFLAPDRFNHLESFTATFSEISKEDQIEKLHNLLGPHMLRRLKADVLTGMPSKSELIVRVELSPMQKKYYKNILTRNFEALNVKSGGTQMSLINIIMELKKCCNHPYLFAKASIEAPKQLNGMYEGPSLIKNAGKFILLQKMLRKLKDGGHRVLIFSQMTMMLDILEDFCDVEGYKFERIDGGITGQMRQNAIDRFNAPGAKQFVFLLSTRAGGLGINLATADTVIIYDSDWNPHNDIQAFSRAHRLGQKHKVMIYRFVTKNSVEERITSVAKKKMLLTHLVVRAGLGAKDGKSMSKSELDDVLRWGTEELFKEEEQSPETADGEGTSDSAKKASEQEIVWDDAAVDFLLDRNKEEEGGPDGEKKEHWTNEYLSSFKVATYNTKEADEEVAEEDDTEVINQGNNEADPNYWEKLLKHHFEHDKETEREQLGKGKRQRKQVNYANDKGGQQVVLQQNAREEEEGSEYATDNEDPAHSDDDFEENGRNRRQNNEQLPPLHARVNGHIEVLGFTTRQRKSYMNAIMRWGMPPENLSKALLWQVRDLRNKSEKVLKAYGALFTRHLCEPGLDTLEFFSDGIPREGMQRQPLLSRIGILSLIRRKLEEFERYNGDWSNPEEKEKIYGMPSDDDSQPDQQVKEEQMDEAPGTSEAVAAPPKPKKKAPPFKFNICDGGFTELHNFWAQEQKLAIKGKEFEVWNRRHDYWLVHAAAFHGYGRYQVNFQEIINDRKYSILSEPFKNQTAAEISIYGDARLRFIQTRYKTLEQALVIEEQLRRAAHINKQQKPDNVGNLGQHFALLENTADSNRSLAKASNNGDRNANLILRDVLGQLDSVLDNMKHDIQKLQVLPGQLGSICDRLQMNEKTILSRLIPGNAQNNAPIPPPGPFIYPSTYQKFETIQPNFASLRPKPSQKPDQFEEIDTSGPSTSAAAMNSIPPDFIPKEEPMDYDDSNTPSTSNAGCSSSYYPNQ